VTLAGAIYSCTMSLIHNRLVVNENRKLVYKYMSTANINTNY
jgi:hypothetical protein